jgi:hypothetical protein
MNATAIPLKALLGDVDPTACKLHCAVYNHEKQPIEVLAADWDEWVGWNRWRYGRNDFNRDYIFAVAQDPAHPTVWLFGGVFEVTGRRNTPNAFSYDVEFREDLMGPYVRRLRLAYAHRGRTVRGLRLEDRIDQMTVAEVLPQPYAGLPFPGLDSINHTIDQLEVVYRQQREDWRGSLSNIKGVYVIHDRFSGKAYVGSASGGVGVWERWRQYVDSLHGHNVDLRALVDREGEAYARANLMFALLEYWPMRTADDHVLERESYWKEVLFSRRLGHNRN